MANLLSLHTVALSQMFHQKSQDKKKLLNYSNVRWQPDTSTTPLPMRCASMGYTSMGFTSMGYTSTELLNL